MYKYFAFISYNSKDTAWGKRVQNKLEHYRMPATLCSEHGWKRKPMSPIFFAPTDIQPGGLTAELQERLKASRHLIVICSPNSAKSQWVGKEIEYFHSLGRTENIHFFIVDGVPHSGNEDTECFNPIVDTLGLPEILGANIHEKVSPWPWVNKERAYVQLITKLLRVEFDSIWQRHKRRMIQQVITFCVGIIAVIFALFAVWFNTKQVDVTMSLNEVSVHNDNLPKMEEAVVTLAIDNETKSDTLYSIDELALFTNIPHSAIGKEAHITVESKNWLRTDTTVILSRDLTLNIARDPHPYGDIQFLIWDSTKEEGLSGVKVSIKGIEEISDSDGRVYLTIPLEKQDSVYSVACDIPLDNNILCNFPTNESTSLQTK